MKNKEFASAQLKINKNYNYLCQFGYFSRFWALWLC